MTEMTSTRRTNLFRIKANEAIPVPILSVGLTDLSQSTIDAYAEIQDEFRIIGNGTFKPSFGEGISAHNRAHHRAIFVILLYGRGYWLCPDQGPCHDSRFINFFQRNSHQARKWYLLE